MLLDHNIPRKVKEVLKRFGVNAFTAIEKGWDKLENGDLVAAAAAANFTVILTRDRRFQTSASANLKKFPNVAIVLIRLQQAEGKSYAEAFEKVWRKAAISPVPGKLIEWP